MLLIMRASTCLLSCYIGYGPSPCGLVFGTPCHSALQPVVASVPLTVSVNTASPSPTVAFYFPVDSSAVWPRLARTYPEVLRC